MNNIIFTIDETLKNNFLKEINEESDSEDANESKDENICLISYELLTDNSIKLPCNHTFNYYPLYKEICNQKLKTNVREIVRLKLCQIKCPYCRTVHNNLIPYCEMDGVSSKYGVTRPNKYVLLPDNCLYIFKSGKSKGEKCNSKCNGQYCKRHILYKTKKVVNNIINTKCKNILKSGKRIGLECGRMNCKYHKSEIN